MERRQELSEISVLAGDRSSGAGAAGAAGAGGSVRLLCDPVPSVMQPCMATELAEHSLDLLLEPLLLLCEPSPKSEPGSKHRPDPPCPPCA